MNKQSSLMSRGSLLERAAEMFDLDKEFARRSDAAVADPPAPAAPSSEAQPPSTDAQKPSVAASAAAETARDPDPDATRIWPAAEPKPYSKRQPERALVQRRTTIIDRDRLREEGLIEPDGPISEIAEEFRIIKRQMLRGSTGRAGARVKDRTILVCSAQPDEGKTFCAVNLALSLALEKDLEVLLIDGDFSNPTIPALLGIQPAPGFTDAIAAADKDPNSFVIQTDVGGLSFLSAGRPANNVTELLASARTREVLATLAETHPRRIIIFDSPPALAASSTLR